MLFEIYKNIIMSAQRKVVIYRNKLNNATDPDKKKLYQKKIDYYQSLELKKPTSYSLQNYVLKLDDPIAIPALGYGTKHRDLPLELMDFERRVPKEDDVVIQIQYCGVCHSDWHVILDEWRNTKYPTIVGHEITGIIVKIGALVKKFKTGDLAALGPNYNSCRNCSQCKSGFEQYCLNDVTETYNMPDRFIGERKPTGPVTYGGYSNIIVVNENYVIKLNPDAKLDLIAPLLCAGSTMYTPLKYLNIKKGDKVGIAGIGGLGHLGIKLSKLFGAYVVAITHTSEKLDSSIKLGADAALLVTDMDSLKPHNMSFDLIIDTIPFNHDLYPYINLMKPNRTLWIVGSMFDMVTQFNYVNRHGVIIRGSSTAGIADTQELVDLCVKNNVYPDIEVIKIQEINKTHQNLLLNKVRYRYVINISSIYE